MTIKKNLIEYNLQWRGCLAGGFVIGTGTVRLDVTRKYRLEFDVSDTGEVTPEFIEVQDVES